MTTDETIHAIAVLTATLDIACTQARYGMANDIEKKILDLLTNIK